MKKVKQSYQSTETKLNMSLCAKISAFTLLQKSLFFHFDLNWCWFIFISIIHSIYSFHSIHQSKTHCFSISINIISLTNYLKLQQQRCTASSPDHQLGKDSHQASLALWSFNLAWRKNTFRFKKYILTSFILAELSYYWRLCDLDNIF